MNASLINTDEQHDPGSASEMPGQVQHLPPVIEPDVKLAAQIAVKRKILIGLAGAWVVTAIAPVPGFLAGIEVLAFLASHIAGVVFCWQLARLLGKNGWLWASLALVPIANLLAFAQITANATKALKTYESQ